MDSAFYLPRTLKADDKLYNETELLKASKYIVVLAEPGAGKTRLLESLASQLGVSTTTARRLSHSRSLPQNTALTIDAFDEFSRTSSEGIYSLLDVASAANPTHLIISSRSSEWANSETHAFKEYFGEDPLVVRLTEFSIPEQQQIFEHHAPSEDFSDFQSEVARFDLDVLLPNPQFLILFADAYLESDRRFSSKHSIFSQALERLAKESNDQIRPYPNPLPTEDKTALASEVYTKLLLSGSEGVTPFEAASERQYPMLSSLVRQTPEINQILATRLFKPGDTPDTHQPVHKIVAEYAAATYLIDRINDQNDHLTLEKCLAVIAPNSVMRDELRGLIGWMAALGNKQFQHQLINLDPYAILANGDPSQLEPSSKKLLISKLKQIEDKDPYFRREDFWRNFSVAGLFTPDVVDEVRSLLIPGSDGHLTGLLLELLVGSAIVHDLMDDIRPLLLSEQEYPRTRRYALECLCSLKEKYNPHGDLAVLIFTASTESLKLAAQAIEYYSPSTFSREYLAGFLRICANLYPKDDNHRSNVIGERHFVVLLIDHFDLQTTENALNDLALNLECHCGKEFYRCKCRIGFSQVMSILLDRYFALTKPPFDSKKIWFWLKDLFFYGNPHNSRSKKSAEILTNDLNLRREILLHAFSLLKSSDEIRFRLRFTFGISGHTGLILNTDDYKCIVNNAFEFGNTTLWTEFLPHHPRNNIREENKKTNHLRRHMKEQARKKPEFMAAWCKFERSSKSHELEMKKFNKSSKRGIKNNSKKSQEHYKENIEYIQSNRELVESGHHWGFLRRFAELTLHAPEKIEEEFGDKSIVNNALYNCLNFIKPDIPSLNKLAKAKCESRWYLITQILHAYCLVKIRRDGNIDSTPASVLRALKVEINIHYNGETEEEREKLNNEINRLAFSTQSEIKQYCREYIEPQIADENCKMPDIYRFCREDIFKEVRPTLSIEWLENYPFMSSHASDHLFNAAIEMSDITTLQNLINRNCLTLLYSPGPEQPDEKLKELRNFWCLRAAYFLDENFGQHWEWLKSDKNMILGFNERSGRFIIRDGSPWPRLTASKIEALLEAYFTHWPKVELPRHWGSDSPQEETAYRYLTDVVSGIASDTPENAIPVLKRLLAKTVYTDLHNQMKSMLAALERKQAHRDFQPPKPAEIVRLLDHDDVVTVEGLRARVLQQLKTYQNEINGGELNQVRRFYEDFKRADTYLREVRSAEVIAEHLKWTLGGQFSVKVEDQTQSAQRMDITVSKTISSKRHLLVIEVKGQWHPELYTAAKTQLYDRYSIHPDAANQGIYLVLWFGTHVAVNNQKRHNITSAEELKASIEATLQDELRGAIDVFVLDLSNPK